MSDRCLHWVNPDLALVDGGRDFLALSRLRPQRSDQELAGHEVESEEARGRPAIIIQDVDGLRVQPPGDRRTDLNALVGRSVRQSFYLENAKLLAFQVQPLGPHRA